MVAMRGAAGTTTPLQSGQLLPHPSPDFEARTKAPHKITRTLKARTNHAYRENRVTLH
jgi:hypothetical protein